MTGSDLAETAARSLGMAIGEPVAATLPAGCPLHMFVCPVVLAPGCLPPPGRMPCRLGTGAALDRQAARGLCLLEGIERFSLQYSAGDADQVTSARLAGADLAVVATALLRLGHPAQLAGGPVADSRGCSVGADLADAALRGLLELVEHDSLAAWWSGQGGFRPVAAGRADPSLDRLLAWLAARQLALRLAGHRHRSGAFACVAVCAEADGGRPATGSAAGLEPARTARRACIEAVVAWLNLAEIESRGTDMAALPEDTRFDVELYRGDRPLPAAPEADAGDAVPAPEPPAGDPAASFARLAAGWGGRFAVFDLSRPTTGLTTARVVRL